MEQIYIASCHGTAPPVISSCQQCNQVWLKCTKISKMTENKCYKVSFPSACFCSTVQLIQILSFLIKVILLLSLGEKNLRLFSYGYVMVTAFLGFQKCRNHRFTCKITRQSSPILIDVRRCQHWRTLFPLTFLCLVETVVAS